jgi:magnesium transporter
MICSEEAEMSYNNFLYLLSDALKNNHIDLALASVKTFQAIDIADVLTQLSAEQSQLLLTHLPDRAYVFSYLPPSEQVKLAQAMPRNILAEIIGEMSSDKRADVFKCLDQEQQNALLPALAQAEREDIRQLSSYLEGTAGSIMSSEYATLKPNMLVNDAIKMLRLEAPDTEMIYFAYVLDEARKILGVLSLKQLILAPEDQNINELMETNVLTAYVDTDQDEVAKTIARYDLLALPIIDHQQMMVGIVTYDDAMDVASEEATEDFLKVGAVNASSKLSIKSAPFCNFTRNECFG